MSFESVDASPAFLRAAGLGRQYHTDGVPVAALREVDLVVARGEWAVVSGPSGCGKSTLLSLLGLLDWPTSGELWLDGRDVTRITRTEASALRNRYIGFVFQSFHLLPELSVLENVALPLQFRGVPKPARLAAAESALVRVGLEALGNRSPITLSGGEQQRAAIARAVVGSPQLLLADEPTGNLDSTNGERIMSLFQSLHAEGQTIVMVTHNTAHLSLGTVHVTLRDGLRVM